MNNVTVVITSCGRFELLKKTMTSLLKYADEPFYRIIVVDNSTDPSTEQHLSNISKELNVPIYALINEQNIGQVSSIDLAYSFVDTEYIFHCEDDWEFFDTGFIGQSKQLLEEMPNVASVNLRVRFDDVHGSMHPISELLTTKSGLPYHQYQVNYLNVWHGFSWNPGLRRKSDYDKVKPYKQYGDESGVGRAYKDLGFVAACLKKSYCKHIGPIGIHNRPPLSNQ